MKIVALKLATLLIIISAPLKVNAQEFQGKAYYFSKTTMDMSRFSRGRQLSEQQKKQMAERFKSWLEKTFILTFNQEESMFKEDEKLASPVGGRGPSVWGSSFSPGLQYKNVKTNTFLQDQEFFGKQFLVKEEMKPYQWQMGSESKKIGQYTCFKATTVRLASEVNWMSANWGRRGQRNAEQKEDSTSTNENNNADAEIIEKPEEVVVVTAWYTPQIPVSQGPSDYWGLPGLILEVNAGTTIMLCSKIVLNPTEKTEIIKPHKGQVVSKKEYHEIINKKMQEFRDSRRRGDGRNSGRRRN